MKPLQAPFPWFGGKSRAAGLVWERFGDVRNYVEPFFGSGAVLLNRPTPAKIETVNDIDGFIANFWRSVALSPEETARYADGPVNEADLHARHVWLVNQRSEFTARLMGDPEYHDPKVAGWWVWGISCSIGQWCSGNGSWNVDEAGRLCQISDGRGVTKALPYITQRYRLHSVGVENQDGISKWFRDLHGRLRSVQITCGDWSRVLNAGIMYNGFPVGVFLDPPYEDFEHAYTHTERVGAQVREWAIANGDCAGVRIALCGYDGEHAMPDDWECVAWKAIGKSPNAARERIWFSPHCLRANQGVLL